MYSERSVDEGRHLTSSVVSPHKRSAGGDSRAPSSRRMLRVSTHAVLVHASYFTPCRGMSVDLEEPRVEKPKADQQDDQYKVGGQDVLGLVRRLRHFFGCTYTLPHCSSAKPCAPFGVGHSGNRSERRRNESSSPCPAASRRPRPVAVNRSSLNSIEENGSEREPIRID